MEIIYTKYSPQLQSDVAIVITSPHNLENGFPGEYFILYYIDREIYAGFSTVVDDFGNLVQANHRAYV